VPLMFFVNFLRLGPPSPADPASSDPYD